MSRPLIAARSRLNVIVNITSFMMAIAVIAVCANVVANQSSWRWRVDATKTRAYSLSEQTQRLLNDLDGEWTIAVVLERDRVDRAVLRQIDEVLDRYAQSPADISVERIDPADPASLLAYERLLARLRDVHRSDIDQYDRAIEAGRRVAEELLLFARQQSSNLEAVLQAVADVESASVEMFSQRAGVMGLLADQGDRVLDEVDRALVARDDQPLPDYESARSILAAMLENWANELYEMARVFEELGHIADVAPEVRQFSRAAAAEYDQLASRLAGASDPLKQLAPLALGRIGTAIQEGDAAVIIGPERAAVIDREQLLPATVLGQHADGRVAFDQRFRGEQVISAAIRSMLRERMPMVVFMHASERSLLTPGRGGESGQADLTAAASILDTSRFRVREWIVGRSERPVMAPDDPVVWVVLPPTTPVVELNREQDMLVREIGRLIEDGAPILFNVYPGLHHRYRATDPWKALASELGIDVDTSRTIVDIVPTGPEQVQSQRFQVVQQFFADHAIAAAVHGRNTYFPLPLPMEADAEASSDGDLMPLVTVAPDRRRRVVDWTVDVANEYLGERQSQDATALGESVEAAIPIAMAGTRRVDSATHGRTTQRFIVVGSGGWMFSNIVDLAQSIGGDRAALQYPGNIEFLLASIAWLAHYDDLIAPSPTSQEVARLDGVTGDVRRLWSILTIAVMPVSALLLGGAVFLWRRRT